MTIKSKKNKRFGGDRSLISQPTGRSRVHRLVRQSFAAVAIQAVTLSTVIGILRDCTGIRPRTPRIVRSLSSQNSLGPTPSIRKKTSIESM